MMQNALVINGRVHEIIEPRFDDETEIPLEKRFHKDIVNQIVPDPKDEAVPGSTWDGAGFGPVPVYTPSWDDIRRKRNKLLAVADWTVLIDSPLSDVVKEAWLDYRATLRNVPQAFEAPEGVVWPSVPDQR